VLEAGDVKDLWAEIRFDESLHRFSTMRVGGPARLLAEPGNEKDAVALIQAARTVGIPFFVIGNGSNIVVSDRGIDALVVRFAERFADVSEVTPEDLPGIPSDMDGNPIPDASDRVYYRAESGALLSSVAVRAAKAGGAGMEFAGGIPGSIGGAIRMNAGAYGAEMGDILLFARSLDADGEVRDYRVDQMELGYRESRFSKKGGTVLSVYLSLKREDPQAILTRMSELNAKRASCQPLNMPSCGSAFKRPPGHYAGAMIEQAGLKGFSIGGAQVSVKHAGFIVNTGNATARDIYDLSQHIIRTVREQSGVTLDPEICFLGFENE
jgi:UDP-N-acetylmuramate dehydrogenase